MLLKNLREEVQKNLKSCITIKKNFDETIEIEEKQNSALKKIYIKNTPKNNNIWIFENEDGEKVFTSGGDKVEKTIIYLQNKKLYIIMIELKATMNCDKLKDTQKKFQDSLSFISIFLLLNQHKDNIYENIKIYPIGILCFNNDNFRDTNISENREICRKMKDSNRSDLNKKFLVTIKAFSLGNIKIPYKTFQNPNPNSDNFEIEFNELID